MTEDEKQQLMAPTVEEAKRLAKCEFIWMGMDGRWKCDMSRSDRDWLLQRTMYLNADRSSRDAFWMRESVLWLMDVALESGALEDVQSVDDLLMALEGGNSFRQFTNDFGDDR